MKYKVERSKLCIVHSCSRTYRCMCQVLDRNQCIYVYVSSIKFEELFWAVNVVECTCIVALSDMANAIVSKNVYYCMPTLLCIV